MPNDTTHSVVPFDSLPDEMLFYIFNMLSDVEFQNAALVCDKWAGRYS